MPGSGAFIYYLVEPAKRQVHCPYHCWELRAQSGLSKMTRSVEGLEFKFRTPSCESDGTSRVCVILLR